MNNLKQKWEKPEIESIELLPQDIITESSGVELPGDPIRR